MTTVSRSQVATARDARDGLAVGRQVFSNGTLTGIPQNVSFVFLMQFAFRIVSDTFVNNTLQAYSSK